MNKALLLGFVAGICSAGAAFAGDPVHFVKPIIFGSFSVFIVTLIGMGYLKSADKVAEDKVEESRQEKVRVQREFQSLRNSNEELKKRVTEISGLMLALQQIAKQTAQSVECKKLLTFLMDICQKSIGAKRASLWLVEQGTRMVRLEETMGWTEAEKSRASVQWGQGILGFCLDKKAVLEADQAKRDPGLVGYYRDAEIPSRICTPLAVGGEVVGLLNIEEFSQKKASGQDDVRLITFLASLAAMSIKNARYYEQAQDKANTDGLTRLYTHRYFQEQLDQEILRTERYGGSFSIILTDIDHFKKFNDTYGHQIGDLVLKETAGCFKTAGLDKSTTLARYGGEEFIVILPHTDKEAARKVAEHLRTCVESRSYDTDAGKLKVNISAGVSTFPDDATVKAPLIEAADHALYRAKKNGRNQVQAATAEDRVQPPAAS